MAFSSIPVYDHQDPPNWHLHQQQQNLITPQLQQLPPPAYTAGGGSIENTTDSIRHSSSVSDRARTPHPEAALIKCPRCGSSDTKFCYFNNYSLSQPRHYCKTCRRYWTRGGSLRNVPVGGGCRRNKKKSKSSSSSKSNNSKSTDHHDQRLKITRSSSTHLAPGNHGNYTILGHHNFLSSLQNLTHVGTIDNPLLSGQNSVLGHQWSSNSNMQQFPFLASGFDQSPAPTILGNNLFTFQNGGGESRLAPPVMTSGDEFRVQGSVKMEKTLTYYTSPARPFLGNIIADDNEQDHSSWGGAWNNGGADATAHFL